MTKKDKQPKEVSKNAFKACWDSLSLSEKKNYKDVAKALLLMMGTMTAAEVLKRFGQIGPKTSLNISYITLGAFSVRIIGLYIKQKLKSSKENEKMR